MDKTRTALVTGAGSGIGRASSLALAEAGWSVILVGRRRESLEETAAQGGGGDGFRVCPADIAKSEEIVAVFDAVRSDHGRLDLLFNNAGTGAPHKPLEER